MTIPPTKPIQVIRFGILGPGRAAARFAQGLSAVPNAMLHAVWGRNPERARAFALRFAVPHVATLDRKSVV